MKWEKARKLHPNKWILFEAIEARSESERRIVDELSVINVYSEGKDSLKEYSEKHRKDKNREMYVYHTKNESLIIQERTWIGVK